jgi:hypothetical protein
MSDIFADFLSSRLPIGGLAAYSLQLSDCPAKTECLSKSLYPSSTSQMLTRLVNGGRTLLPSGGQPAHYCFTFECHRVYIAVRPDGNCLALLVENNLSSQMLRIQQTLQDFIGLSLP